MKEIKRITRAELLGGHTIVIEFDDGKKGGINFRPLLLKSNNPLVRQYLDEEKFKTFDVTPHGLHWDNSLDISSETLYKQAFPT